MSVKYCKLCFNGFDPTEQACPECGFKDGVGSIGIQGAGKQCANDSERVIMRKCVGFCLKCKVVTDRDADNMCCLKCGSAAVSMNLESDANGVVHEMGPGAVIELVDPNSPLVTALAYQMCDSFFKWSGPGEQPKIAELMLNFHVKAKKLEEFEERLFK